jgi:hypothetical protein
MVGSGEGHCQSRARLLIVRTLILFLIGKVQRATPLLPRTVSRGAHREWVSGLLSAKLLMDNNVTV